MIIFAYMNLMLLIRSGIQQRLALIRIYLITAGIGLVLLVFRQFIPTDKPMLFLIWNLFLALIPLGISTLMLEMRKRKIKGLTLIVTAAIWLVFFPNAPYMLTDYIHLTYGDRQFFWLDAFTLSYFAFAAFVAAVISLRDIAVILSDYLQSSMVNLAIFCISILSGIGIYLGRDLRFNSWDVVTKPGELIHESIMRISNPFADLYTWFAATIISFLLFGAFVVTDRTRS